MAERLWSEVDRDHVVECAVGWNTEWTESASLFHHFIERWGHRKAFGGRPDHKTDHDNWTAFVRFASDVIDVAHMLRRYPERGAG